jgi:hypothetical protein
MGVAREPNRDVILEALDALEDALRANAERERMIHERIKHVRELRAQGVSYKEISTHGIPIVQLVTEMTSALDTYGVRLRRLAALELYEQGLTMEQIAAVFGVTRQRVSTLLKSTSG